MKLEGGYIDQVERDLTLRVKEVITIPAGDPLEGLVVYVCSSYAVINPQVDRLKEVARLVAAAAELLEACKRLVRQFRICLVHSGTDEEFAYAAVAEYQAAIAKAEG